MSISSRRWVRTALPAAAVAASLTFAPLAVPAQAVDNPAAVATASGATPLAATAEQTLQWELSKRALLWDAKASGDGVSIVPTDESEPANGSLKLTKATGWVNKDTKDASVHWPGSVTYTINGAQTITFQDFALEVTGGSGTITATVSSTDPNQPANNKDAKRVTVATFKSADVTIDGTTATITATPDYEGVTYVRDEDISYDDAWPTELINNITDSVRSWFYASGSRWDDQKKPSAFTATLTLGEDKPDTGSDTGSDSGTTNGVKDARINDAGHLILTFPDGTTKDLGKVTGKDGAEGKPGQAGADGKDGQAGADGKDGKEGRGIASVTTNAAGQLVITLTDGTVLDPVDMPAPAKQPMAPESIVAIVLGVIATLLGSIAAIHTIAAAYLFKG